MHITEDTLRSLLVNSGFITEEEFVAAKDEARRSNRTIADVLIGGGKISEDYLLETIQPYYDAHTINLKKVIIPQETLELIPELYAKSKKIILFEFDKSTNVAKLGMLDPFDFDAIEYVRARLGAWVEPYLMTATSLRYGLKQYRQQLGLEFENIIAESIKQTMATAADGDISKTAASVPIVTIVDTILEHAVTLNTSDIHFEPLPNGLLVRFRVDGIMQEIVELPQHIAPILVARVKILTALQIDEHRIPQDGRFHFEMDDSSSVDVRVNIIPVFHGEKVEMRILKSTSRPLTLRDLGLSDVASLIISEEIKKPHGMILVTGPTGHGKTTTLYAILHILNTPSVNITTIEDPIEYEFPRVNQTQVNAKAGVTFANGLRALLRQNPDIIMIGEIRDAETVDIAIHAALTGHLVLSSLHTNDAPSALPRLIDMGAEAFLLTSTVNVIIAQRLVRKVCTSCVVSYPTPPEIKKMIKEQMHALNDTHIKEVPETLFKGKGCHVCSGTGFQGQIGIFEVFQVTEQIRELMLKGSSVAQMRKEAIAEGMITMFEDGLKKVELGITPIEEVLRVVRE